MQAVECGGSGVQTVVWGQGVHAVQCGGRACMQYSVRAGRAGSTVWNTEWGQRRADSAVWEQGVHAVQCGGRAYRQYSADSTVRAVQCGGRATKSLKS